MTHSRMSDTEQLIQFTKNQGIVEPDLLEAVLRLEECHKEGLVDYGAATMKSGYIEKSTNVERVVFIAAIAGMLVGSILGYFIYGLPA